MNKIIAKVNGKEITQSHMDMLLRSLGQRAAQFQSEDGQKQLVEELINQELFYFDAIENKLDESEEFKAEMEVARENILKQINIKTALDSVNVTEDEMKNFYEENKESYVKPEQVKASHILVDTEEEANSIAADLAGGKSFEICAAEFSKCPSKENGGDLGAFGRGQMVPEFEKAAFEMEVGAVSAPVQTQFGFHIIKVTEKSEPGTMTYEEVKPQIQQQLFITAQNNAYLSKVEELRGKYSVEVL